jgi:hypothetical protein
MSDYKSADSWLDELPFVKGYDEDIHAVSIHEVKAIQADARAPLERELDEMLGAIMAYCAHQKPIDRGWYDSEAEYQSGCTASAQLQKLIQKHCERLFKDKPHAKP